MKSYALNEHKYERIIEFFNLISNTVHLAQISIYLYHAAKQQGSVIKHFYVHIESIISDNKIDAIRNHQCMKII